MAKFGWDMYVKYAWGANELRPLSKRVTTKNFYLTSIQLLSFIIVRIYVFFKVFEQTDYYQKDFV